MKKLLILLSPFMLAVSTQATGINWDLLNQHAAQQNAWNNAYGAVQAANNLPTRQQLAEQQAIQQSQANFEESWRLREIRRLHQEIEQASTKEWSVTTGELDARNLALDKEYLAFLENHGPVTMVTASSFTQARKQAASEHTRKRMQNIAAHNILQQEINTFFDQNNQDSKNIIRGLYQKEKINNPHLTDEQVENIVIKKLIKCLDKYGAHNMANQCV